MDNTGP